MAERVNVTSTSAGSDGISRRTFLRISAAGALTLYGVGAGGVRVALAESVPDTLAPHAIRKFVSPLLIPPVMPKAGTRVLRNGKNADFYEISLRQFQQQVLPAGMPTTTVWGYGPNRTASDRGLLIHNAPSLTIEARWNAPVVVRWVNELRDGDRFLPHLLPVDPTLHWANPPGGTAGRDSRPVFTETPGRYDGPVPMVTHVHGMVEVDDHSDGYAEAWFLPDSDDVPPSWARTGTWYEFFAAKAAADGLEWGPGYAEFLYPNSQRASTAWYHDHTLGMTRVNVYAGPAGFYLIRGGPAGDDAVVDVRTGSTAVLPGPAPRANDPLPPRKPYHEIPLAIQDRSFRPDGSLFYPDTRELFDGITGPFVPETDVSPIWNPEWFGDCLMVNGRTWPWLEVERRRYRLRILNGCQARFLILDFGQIPGVDVWQIGTEGGFLPRPVHLTGDQGNRLLLGPAERADVIVDFGAVPPGRHVLRNVGPDEPFGGGEPDDDFEPAEPRTTGQVMQFRVVASAVPDPTTPPRHLGLPAVTPLEPGTHRSLALMEMMSDFYDAPAEARLGVVHFDEDGDGRAEPLMWMDPVTEDPAPGSVETWEFYNTTVDAHPMHVHDVMFQVVDRRPIRQDDGGIRVDEDAEPRPPEPSERGFKDTVIAYPGEVTRVRMRFGKAGQFTWHCHIVEHEDNEMMRPYRIGPPQPGQPPG